MKSLYLRNLFYVVLQPGIVAGLIPYLLVRNQLGYIWANPLHSHHYAGIFISVSGLIILLAGVFQFASKGKGTLSPIDPTKQLVTSGLYRFSRNPMYIGVMLMLMGEIIFVRSFHLWIYSIVIFMLFYGFIILFEEPRLRTAFGDEYEAYCKKVRRWI
jgi:protein-S-isoprenylcysteine O-methyltransferase Ste14